MPLTLTERVSSRRWGGGAVTFDYVLTGTSDDATARNLLTSSIPASYSGLARNDDSINIEPVWVDTTSGDGQWECTVQFGPMAESNFTFDTSGGTQHITQSLSTVNKYAPSGQTAPDFKGGVGFKKDGFEGVDVTLPVYSFGETHFLDDATVTNTYKGTLFTLTGRTNNASFKGLADGECLFLGASGSKRSGDLWEIQFRFAASPNRTGITVGDITNIAKKGWEYLWVLYADQVDDDAAAMVQRPLAAYVEKVYEDGSFAGLGIGT